jgi:hypothetical protein
MDWYISKDYKHAINEIAYSCKGKELMNYNRLIMGWWVKNTKNLFSLPHCSTF